MNYDRLAAGERLRTKRILLGLTQEEIAEKINRTWKYYADIERGSCGMSTETLLSLASVLDMSLDYIILGKSEKEGDDPTHTDEVAAIMSLLDTYSPKNRSYALKLLRLFLVACSSE